MALTPLLLALAAAAGNLIGAMVLVRQSRRSLGWIDTSLAFGAGFMLATVLVGVLPEVFDQADGATPLFILGGYLAVHLAHHVLTPHFHFGEETHHVSAAAGLSALLGLSVHSFFDGVAIASGFLTSAHLGLLMFFAVLLHKLPEGVAIASVVMVGGRPGRDAVLAGAALGGATVVGVLLTGIAEPLQTRGLALAAGVTLYVAASNLVPEFQHKRGWRSPLAFFGGAAALLLVHLMDVVP
ncbi:MAG TPA: ZIP family metal transporter [Gemmatimonadales bacterium]